MKKKKKEKLMEVFENIDLNFKEIYPKICRNGEGYLHLENKDEPFEGGLIIRARPPGKKMRDIRYLSGGEKSQVAIAFILALQRYDPSPFYVLDEVDQNISTRIEEVEKIQETDLVGTHRRGREEENHVRTLCE